MIINVLIPLIAIFKYNDTFKKKKKKKKNFKKVSTTPIFTLACSDFFWNLETFFFEGSLLLQIAIILLPTL